MSNDCAGEQFKELSKEATKEILGENLFITIAISMEGDVTVFYPNGEFPAHDFKICTGNIGETKNEEQTPPFTITISTPNKSISPEAQYLIAPPKTCNTQISYFRWPPCGFGGVPCP
ncbi:MAG: hypothetical protein ABL933_18805 [Methyloglobulus sp.]|nr:hypothetical protein [Methyloglobulus sp.]